MNYIRKYFTRDDGSVLTITALVAPAIIGITALGVDGSYYLMTKSNLQTAADAAAMAAAWEISQESPEYAESTAIREATDNGFDPNSGTLTLTEFEEANGEITVTVNIQQDAPLWFANIIRNTPVRIGVSSESLVSNEYLGSYCILTLDESASGALTTSGTVDINSANCGIAVNSSSETALELNGSVDLNFGVITLSGDYEINGGAAELNYSSIRTHASRVRDPYSDIDVLDTTPCSKTAIAKGTKVTGSGTATLNPGVYCGGITISGNNNIILNPGVYVLDGGGLKVTGGGSLTGDGVTIILTNTGNGSWGTIDISGGKTINITASQTGYYAGLAFFVDREAPDDGTLHSITGTAGIYIDGVIYIPTQNLRFGGTSDSSSTFDGCTKLIAQIIIFSGTPIFGTNCDESPVRNIGDRIVKLSY